MSTAIASGLATWNLPTIKYGINPSIENGKALEILKDAQKFSPSTFAKIIGYPTITAATLYASARGVKTYLDGEREFNSFDAIAALCGAFGALTLQTSSSSTQRQQQPLSSAIKYIETLNPQEKCLKSNILDCKNFLPEESYYELLRESSTLMLCHMWRKLKKQGKEDSEINEILFKNSDLQEFLLNPTKDLKLKLDTHIEFFIREPTLLRLIISSISKELLKEQDVKKALGRCLEKIDLYPSDPDTFITLINSTITLSIGTNEMTLPFMDAYKVKSLKLDLKNPKTETIKIIAENEALVIKAFDFLTKGNEVIKGTSPEQKLQLYEISKKYEISYLTKTIERKIIKTLDDFKDDKALFKNVCEKVLNWGNLNSLEALTLLSDYIVELSNTNNTYFLNILLQHKTPIKLYEAQTFYAALINSKSCNSETKLIHAIIRNSIESTDSSVLELYEEFTEIEQLQALYQNYSGNPVILKFLVDQLNDTKTIKSLLKFTNEKKLGTAYNAIAEKNAELISSSS